MGLNKVLELDVALTFRQQNLVRQLEPYLADCNLYLVSRRPRTYIDPASVRISRRGKLTGRYVTLHGSRQRSSRFRFPFLLGGARHLRWRTGQPRDYFQIYDDRTAQSVFHGDPWGLIFLGASSSSQLAEHEVIYVGRATGTKRNRTSLDRIKSHETIQKIYADHFGTDYDIFITVVRVNGSSSTYDLSTLADFGMARHATELFVRSMSSSRDIYVEMIHLAEAALIAYFKPLYNRQHKNNFPHKSTKVSDLLIRYSYTNLSMLLSHNATGIRFWSGTCLPKPVHSTIFTLPEAKEVSREEFAESAGRTREQAAKSLRYVERLAYKASLTCALLPADLPSRLPDTE